MLRVLLIKHFYETVVFVYPSYLISVLSGTGIHYGQESRNVDQSFGLLIGDSKILPSLISIQTENYYFLGDFGHNRYFKRLHTTDTIHVLISVLSLGIEHGPFDIATFWGEKKPFVNAKNLRSGKCSLRVVGARVNLAES